MTAYNIRRPLPETYDPKQRIVGALVLALLMYLLYIILKFVLGISAGSGIIVLPERRPDEEIVSAVASGNVAGNNTETTQPATAAKSKNPLPDGFVFLDISARPMGGEVYTAPPTTEQPKPTEQVNTSGWTVQAASFREEDKAKVFAERLKQKDFPAEVVKVDNWYVVRLPIQQDRAVAEEQLRQLRSTAGTRGLIKKIN